MYAIILYFLLRGVWISQGVPSYGDAIAYKMDSQETCNKQVVLQFYQKVLGDKDVDAADQYVDAENYIQHNPLVADGLDALKVGMREWFQGQSKVHIDVHHISAEGDLVWIHTRSVDSKTGKVTSVMDIYKLRAGKLVEHWDVLQEVPEVSANQHPMF